MAGQRFGICSRVPIFASSSVTNRVAFSTEYAAIRIHISSRSTSAIPVISTRYFARNFELAQERTYRPGTIRPYVLFGSGWSVRRNRGDAGLTRSDHYYGFGYRARASRPASPLRWLRGIFLLAQPPFLCEDG